MHDIEETAYINGWVIIRNALILVAGIVAVASTMLWVGGR